MKTILSRKTAQKRKWLLTLLLTTFLIKLVLSFYFSHLAACEFYDDRSFGRIVSDRGDTFSYLGAIDNLIEHGEYYFWNGARRVYAGRMPYYGAPYFLLRQFFEKETAHLLLVILQVFFDSLATIVFALLCFRILKSKAAFWIGYTIYFCSFNYLALTSQLSPESFSLSFFVFFLYFYQRFWTKRKSRDLLYAAAALAVLTVLKPYFVIIYPAFFIFVLEKKEVFDLRFLPHIRRTIAVIALPLLILLTPWIIRNQIVLNKFIPAQEDIRAGYDYTQSYLAFADFAGAWGSGSVPWDAKEAGCYFLLNPPYGCSFTLPQYALTDQYGAEDVERVRQDFLKLQENYSPELDRQVALEFRRLTEIYKVRKPFMYYVGSKLILTKKLFWHTNNYNLLINPSFKCFQPFQQLFKVAQFAVYLLALTIGVFGLIKLVLSGKAGFLFIVVSLLILIFFVELRTVEHRYVNPVHQILLLGIPGALLSFLDGLKFRRD